MAKVRIIVEVLVVLALGLGVWKLLNPSEDKRSTSPRTEITESSQPKLLRGTAKKKGTSTEEQPRTRREEELPRPVPTASASGTVDAAATVDATKHAVDATKHAVEALGGLQITIIDEADERLAVNGWLVSDDCGWRIRIFDGVVDKQIEAMRCDIYAILDVDGKQFATEKQAMQTHPGETLSMRFAVTLPSTEPAPSIAHAGLGLLQRDGYAEVVEILAGSSAAEQGLQVGDAVLTLNGIAVTELTQDELATMLQGEPDTPLQLGIAIEQHGEIVAGDVNLIRSTIAE